MEILPDLMANHRETGKPTPASKMPLWMLVLIIASVLPVVAWPWFMAHYDFQPDDSRTLLVIAFPIFAVLCGFLAYKSYSQRKELSYILLVILWLSYGAICCL